MGIHIFVVQLWNSFLEELNTTKQKIICTNITQDFYIKKKKLYEIINITIVETTENVYHVTRQNLHFAHAPFNKKGGQRGRT